MEEMTCGEMARSGAGAKDTGILMAASPASRLEMARGHPHGSF